MLSKTLKKTIPTASRAFGWQAAGNKGVPSIFSNVDKHGFLPSSKPMAELPSQFNQMNELMDAMPHLINGEPVGLLAKNEFRKTIKGDFPDLTEEIRKVDVNDARLNAALFRDYSFASASYMLESCHHGWGANNTYGRGEDVLPAKLAVPMVELAKRIGYG